MSGRRLTVEDHLASVSVAEDGYLASDVLHWYDFVCPFCYLAQPDNEALASQGVKVIELAFVAHPEIPAGGLPIAPTGPRFEMIGRLATERHMPLLWSDRLPNTRLALAAAEWVRTHDPERAHAFRTEMFAANFARREDIGALPVVLNVAARVGIEERPLLRALRDGSGDAALGQSDGLGRRRGVRGTPAWWIDGQLIEGLQPDGLRL